MTQSAEPSDGTLIAAVLAGDQEQFSVLAKRYAFALTRVARSRLGRDDWADDVVQETFLCALRWLHTYDSRFSFRTWLWTILLNQCHRQWKRQSRNLLFGAKSMHEDQRMVEAEIASHLRSSDTPERQAMARERNQLLDSLLRRLPEAQADALRLRFHGELKFQEIADAMRCGISTAKNRVKWGLMKLAEYLGPTGEFAKLGLTLGDTRDENDA